MSSTRREAIIDNSAEQASGQDNGGESLELHDRKPEVADVVAEVVAGLSRTEKRIAPKYFYDETGSELFEAITELPEYYLTRTELALLDDCLPELAGLVDENACLVEYGSGSSLKVRKLLEHLKPGAYVPVDISADHLLAMAEQLKEDFPALAIYPTGADFTRTFELPTAVAGLPKLGFFPGSSIGNFSPDDAVGFLGNLGRTLGSGCRLIIGVDRKKDPAILEAAYNDAAGVTAAFNLNLLTHLGELLDADLDPARFRHRAAYDGKQGAVRMFLDVIDSHEVDIGGHRIRFEAGEAVHTENSHKYDLDEFVRLVGRAGFEPIRVWSDPKDWFSVLLLTS